MLILVYSFLFFTTLLADDCTDCVTSGRTFCVETSQCGISNCTTSIDIPLNCPAPPHFGYDDEFMRSEIMVLTTAAQNENPQLCFDNQLPTMKLYQTRTVNCSKTFDDVTCVGYTAYDTKRKVIAMVFKGAHGHDQILGIYENMMKYGLESYYTVTNGKIVKTVQDNFMQLWNGGMQQDLRNLKYKYPNYELWINGHSLGSVLAWAASSWIVNIGLYKPNEMRVIVMGAPRLGDYNWAVWHTKTFSYNFHIVHRADPVAHMSNYIVSTNSTLFYPRTEVWYNNYMRQGDPYKICQEADGDYCSGSIQTNMTQFIDHLYYFNIDIPEWGHAGCPMNISAYAQP